MLFSEIIGNQAVKQRLIQTAGDGRISHAQLFLGPEGSGALALAIAYAQYINCTARTQTDACGQCSSCVKYNKLVHPDLHFVFPVAATDKVKKDPVSDLFLAEWRKLFAQNPYFGLNQWLEFLNVENKQVGIQKNESAEIIKKLNLKTYEADFKVMVIWLPEKMNDSSANKLLKILEEPPAKTLFLLVSENEGEILQTILSRTQLVKISKLDSPELKKTLQAKYQLADDVLTAVVQTSNGNYNAALQLLETSDQFTENFEWFTRYMRLSYSRNVPELLQWADGLASQGRERLKNFLEYSLKMVRENFMLNNHVPQIVYLNNTENQFSQKFHTFINEVNVATLTRELNEAHYHIERNGNAKIILFDLALKTIIAFAKK